MESSLVLGIHTIVLRHHTWSVIPARDPSILVHHRALVRQARIVVILLFLLVPCLLNRHVRLSRLASSRRSGLRFIQLRCLLVRSEGCPRRSSFGRRGWGRGVGKSASRAARVHSGAGGTEMRSAHVETHHVCLHSPASSCSNSGTNSSAGPKSRSVIAFNTSPAVIDLPDLARAWSCALNVNHSSRSRQVRLAHT